MANYNCTVRTNYFRVKDEDAFRELMSRVYGSESPVELFERTDDNGCTLFGFGAYGGIAGVKNAMCDDDDDIDESAYDEFIDELKKLVAEDDAIIILEAGNEKLRYVTGQAHIITHNEERWLDMTKLAAQQAALMLQNPNFTTTCEY